MTLRLLKSKLDYKMMLYPNTTDLLNCSSGTCQLSNYCRKFFFIGIYLLILLISSLLLNAVVIVAYAKKKKSSIDIQIMTILISNLITATFCLPSLIYSNLNCNWNIPTFICSLSGGTMYFNGCLCIFTITTISIDR